MLMLLVLVLLLLGVLLLLLLLLLVLLLLLLLLLMMILLLVVLVIGIAADLDGRALFSLLARSCPRPTTFTLSTSSDKARVGQPEHLAETTACATASTPGRSR